MPRLFMPVVIIVALVLTACQGVEEPGSTATVQSPPAAMQAAALDGYPDDVRFAAMTTAWIEELLALEPEWAIYRGRYEHADRVSIPDAARRARRHDFIAASLERLSAFDERRLSPARRAELHLIRNRLAGMAWYQERFRDWQWAPSTYNVAGPIAALLNTDFAPEADRLRLVSARLAQVPDYYLAARNNIDRPTLEHTELAITQNRGALSVLAPSLLERVRAAGLEDSELEVFDQRLTAARAAVQDWVAWLEDLHRDLSQSGQARPFRIGEALFEEKFAIDIQAGFSAADLYARALQERDRLHAEMDAIAMELWPTYFPDQQMPAAALQRIGRLVDHLSDRHVALEDFVDEIRRQIPALAEFVREHDLLDQDPDKPLVVRETPEYLRGGGAIASISAPGPFNPGADTYYNVTPLETYGPELAASYLREYNHWILQVLNIHEAIPGHYTQLLHANRSPSLVKSLFGNGAMIEGWAVYAERMMLEQGWGDHQPELWLMYGKWALRVVFNAILDHSVHVLGMEEEEAVRLMREQAFQEYSEATQKWRRLTLSQVQLSSYFSGFAEIYDFRERRQAAHGDHFNLRDFHNRFLSYGSSPVAVIIELMGED